MSGLNQKRLKELLDYDPKTGVFRWRGSRPGMRADGIAGHVEHDGYRRITIDGTAYRAHRLAWLYVHGQWPDGQIDHRNGIRGYNGIKNLRVAKTQAEQHQNRKLNSNNTSGYPGVSWHGRGGNWQAHIDHNGKRHHIGQFSTPEEAAEAYREAKARLHTFNPTVRGFDYKRAGNAT